jgi:cyclopropane-fatty-acyl-phospholipid synthase
MFPLAILLRGFVKRGRLHVTDYDGRAYDFGDTTTPVDVAVAFRDPSTARRIARNPELNVGEAYVEGSLTIEKGSLLAFLQLLLVNMQIWNASPAGRTFYRVQDAMRLPLGLNRINRSRRNVKHHYDLSDELFSLFLDSDRQYSCAYYRAENDDLETAQLAKKQHIAAKLNIRPGQHILDIGSGWGGLALYLARHYPNVRVTGLTLSDEQFKRSNERAREQGVEDRVTFKLLDYRRETGSYDRIVSVGMFEHVGRPHFSAYFDKLSSLLAPEGVALVHTIGYQTPPAPINAWLRRYIFPGAYLPSMSQLAPIIEKRRLWLTDLENLRLHYAATLSAWHERFDANRGRIAALYDERFCRMWEFYLRACEAGFRWSGLTVFQMQIAKTIDALPVTREYMVREEERLRAMDAITEMPELPGIAAAAAQLRERGSSARM